MNKIKHSDVLIAIQFAVANNQIASELNRRDKDKKLDCNNINCSVISPIDAPVKLFEMKFNHAYVSKPDQNGEDIVVIIESNNGTLRIVEWRNQ
jgi:hypothetical protein